MYQNTISKALISVLRCVMLCQPRRGDKQDIVKCTSGAFSTCGYLLVLEFSALKERESKWCGFPEVFCLLTTQFSVHCAFHLDADYPIRASTGGSGLSHFTVCDLQSPSIYHLIFVNHLLPTSLYLSQCRDENKFWKFFLPVNK